LAAGKFSLCKFVGKYVRFGQLFFVERIKTDLLEPHGLFSFSLKAALYRQSPYKDKEQKDRLKPV